jgi:hypothetical protein
MIVRNVQNKRFNSNLNGVESFVEKQERDFDEPKPLTFVEHEDKTVTSTSK